MMIATYLTDTVVWKPAAGRDAFGNPIAGDAVEIKAWNAWARKELHDQSGAIVVCDYSILVEDEVKAGDILEVNGEDRVVKGVEGVQDLFGRPTGRWCYC